MFKVRKPYARLFLGVAIAMVLLDLVTFRFDDIIYYWKASELALGHVPSVDPNDWTLAMHVEHNALPQRYRPHPGPNLPYLDFTCEYPPLVWPFILLPHIVGDDLYVYDLAFIVEMILLHLLAISLLLRVNRQLRVEPMDRWQTMAFLSLFTTTVSVVVLRRFDVVSATLVSGAVLALAAKRTNLAGFLLGLGAAAKLWPGMLVPFFVLPSLVDRKWREAVQLAVIATVVYLVSHIPVMSYAGMKAFSYLSYHGARGMQIESMWGNLAIIAKKLTGDSLVTDPSYGALHIALEPGTKSILKVLSYIGMAVGFGSMWWLAFKRIRATSDHRERFQALLLGCVGLVFVTFATAKVFSPQYMIWVFPFIVTITGKAGRDLRIGTLLATLLTRIEFPALVTYVSNYSWIGTLAVFARNLVVVWLVWRTWRALREEAAPVTAPATEPEPAVVVA